METSLYKVEVVSKIPQRIRASAHAAIFFRARAHLASPLLWGHAGVFKWSTDVHLFATRELGIVAVGGGREAEQGS